MGTRVRWHLLVLLILLPAVGAPYLYSQFRDQQHAAKRSLCDSHLCIIRDELFRYHDIHNGLPPPYITGPDGVPWHSWRVLVLRSSGLSDAQDYRDYRLDEPWNGPNNSKLLARPTPSLFVCSADPEVRATGLTNYFVVVGSGTAFPKRTRASFNSITRPRSETILVVEATGQNIHWMEPRDLAFDEMSFSLNDPHAPSVSSRHKHPMVLLADGTQRPLTQDNPDALRRMLLIRPEP